MTEQSTEPTQGKEWTTGKEWAHKVGIALIILAFTLPVAYCQAEHDTAYYSMKAECFKAGGTWRRNSCVWPDPED